MLFSGSPHPWIFEPSNTVSPSVHIFPPDKQVYSSAQKERRKQTNILISPPSRGPWHAWTLDKTDTPKVERRQQMLRRRPLHNLVLRFVERRATPHVDSNASAALPAGSDSAPRRPHRVASQRRRSISPVLDGAAPCDNARHTPASAPCSCDGTAPPQTPPVVLYLATLIDGLPSRCSHPRGQGDGRRRPAGLS